LLDGAFSTAVASGPDVRVTTDKASYCLEEAIGVSIANRLDQPVFATSGQSYCTIVSLQRQQGDDWTMIGSCIAGAPPANISIAANAVLSFSLKPGRYDYEALEAGNYRISFTYGIGSIEGPRGEARSPVFTARDCAEN
jgi:hypothetical protein